MPKTIHSPEYGKVINKLQLARKEASLTQVRVAKKLRKPQSYISKIERGERRVDITELKKLSDLYGKKITYFVD